MHFYEFKNSWIKVGKNWVVTWVEIKISLFDDINFHLLFSIQRFLAVIITYGGDAESKCHSLLMTRSALSWQYRKDLALAIKPQRRSKSRIIVRHLPIPLPPPTQTGEHLGQDVKFKGYYWNLHIARVRSAGPSSSLESRIRAHARIQMYVQVRIYLHSQMRN